MSWTAVGAALLAVLALAVTANNRPEFGEEIKEIIRQIHNTCVDRTGAAEEDIANCENGIFKEDAKLKCYMSCLLEEATAIDTDEVVDYEFLVSMISEEWKERFSKMIYACRYLDTPDKDGCQRAFDVHKCAHGQDPEMGSSKPKSAFGKRKCAQSVLTGGDGMARGVFVSGTFSIVWYRSEF